MKLLKEYRLALLITLITVSAVLVKNYGKNTFRYDAVKHSAASLTKENIISAEETGKLSGELLILNFDKGKMNIENSSDQVHIPADSILSDSYKKLIFKHKGSIVLISDDKAKSAAIWMILSQMGKENVYILSD